MNKPKRRIKTYDKNIKKALDKLGKELQLSVTSQEIITRAIKYFINYSDDVTLEELFPEK